jgi:2-polyprenyl-3-methyl-5-hydroxy-6-metoxy-1,4-benzoquinol methylase
MAGIWRWKTAQFAERNWWRQYLGGKDVETYLQWKREYWMQLIMKCEHYVDIKDANSILDAGCGPAGVFMLFQDKKTVAFDPLILLYETDLPHFRQSMYPAVQFIAQGFENLELDQHFDLVFCMNAINHVQDIEKSMDVLVSKMESGGHLVISIDAHTHTIFKHIFRLLPGDVLHPHQYDLNEYQNMLTSRGCTLMATELLKHEFFFDHYLLIAKKN